MTKRQLIDQIVSLNQSAEAEFLAQFPDQDLDEYLKHLTAARMPRPWRWRGGSYSVETAAMQSAPAAATCTLDPPAEVEFTEDFTFDSAQTPHDSATTQGRLF